MHKFLLYFPSIPQCHKSYSCWSILLPLPFSPCCKYLLIVSFSVLANDGFVSVLQGRQTHSPCFLYSLLSATRPFSTSNEHSSFTSPGFAHSAPPLSVSLGVLTLSLSRTVLHDFASHQGREDLAYFLHFLTEIVL